MKHGSLFSGIGGFDLAAQWMGWENVFHCEIAEFPRKVLHHYWPNAISYENIKETDFTPWHGRIDVISGGFPCQPYSIAGKRLGKEDDRHLWPEMLRCIREIQPKWVVGENVLGIVNWDGGLVFDEVQSDLEAEGYEVQTYVLPACAVNAPHRRDRVWFVAKNTNDNGRASELGQKESGERQFGNACAGDNEPISSNDAEIRLVAHTKGDKNQRHGQGGFYAEPSGFDEQRFVADTSSDRRQRAREGFEVKEGLQQGPGTAGELEGGLEGFCGKGLAPDTDSECSSSRGEGEKTQRIRGRNNGEQEIGIEPAERVDRFSGFQQPSPDPDSIGVQGQPVDAGASKNAGQRREGFEADGDTRGIGGWENFPTTEPTICGGDDGLSSRLDGITFSKWRNESIKAYGNAIVPQVVYEIFKAIEEWENKY